MGGMGRGSTNLARVFGSSVKAFTCPDWTKAGSLFINNAVVAKPERRRNFRLVITRLPWAPEDSTQGRQRHVPRAGARALSSFVDWRLEAEFESEEDENSTSPVL